MGAVGRKAGLTLTQLAAAARASFILGPLLRCSAHRRRRRRHRRCVQAKHDSFTTFSQQLSMGINALVGLFTAALAGYFLGCLAFGVVRGGGDIYDGVRFAPRGERREDGKTSD